jgi:hypothetical protein
MALYDMISIAIGPPASDAYHTCPLAVLGMPYGPGPSGGRKRRIEPVRGSSRP